MMWMWIFQWAIVNKFQLIHYNNWSFTSMDIVSVERMVLDLESEAMRGPGSIPTRGNIFF